MARAHHDVLSVEWVKLELIRTAYATRGGLFAAMDPRAVVIWYILLALVPWFTHNITVLAGLFVIGAVSIFLARVGPLILGLFVLGLGAEVIYMAVAAWLFGGNLETLIALAALHLKLGVVSLEEFSTVFEGYRLRTAPPEKRGFLAWRVGAQWAQLAVLSFYPIFLNTAKSVRTTVEALETRGFTRAGSDARGRQIRMDKLQIRPLDVWVIALTVLAVVGAFVAGSAWPVYR